MQYEPQATSDERPSSNFVTVLLTPIKCDYLKLPRPAEDTRGQIAKVQHKSSAYESRMQPSREQQRWSHTLDENTNTWTVVELNP
jgi:hypothetical protein